MYLSTTDPEVPIHVSKTNVATMPWSSCCAERLGFDQPPPGEDGSKIHVLNVYNNEKMYNVHLYICYINIYICLWYINIYLYGILKYILSDICSIIVFVKTFGFFHISFFVYDAPKRVMWKP